MGPDSDQVLVRYRRRWPLTAPVEADRFEGGTGAAGPLRASGGEALVTAIEERVARVRERIAEARARRGRSDVVELVAVTKGHAPEVARAARAAGLMRLGENRVLELEQKRAALGNDIEWHLIGHLQRNKVRRALPVFDLLESLDSMRLAESVSKEAARIERTVPVLVQVNASGEAAKGGFEVEEAVEAVGRMVELACLRVVGLMTMAPLTDDVSVLRRTFARTRAAYEACGAVSGFEARHLSMGMTNDFEIAVEEGSTMVRLGTVLFGERP